MTEDEHRRIPTPEQPLNADRRPRVTPILAVVGLVVAIAIVFGVITLLRYAT